jgi:hypothetical protein
MQIDVRTSGYNIIFSRLSLLKEQYVVHPAASRFPSSLNAKHQAHSPVRVPTLLSGKLSGSYADSYVICKFRRKFLRELVSHVKIIYK